MTKRIYSTGQDILSSTELGHHHHHSASCSLTINHQRLALSPVQSPSSKSLQPRHCLPSTSAGIRGPQHTALCCRRRKLLSTARHRRTHSITILRRTSTTTHRQDGRQDSKIPDGDSAGERTQMISFYKDRSCFLVNDIISRRGPPSTLVPFAQLLTRLDCQSKCTQSSLFSGSPWTMLVVSP